MPLGYVGRSACRLEAVPGDGRAVEGGRASVGGGSGVPGGRGKWGAEGVVDALVRLG